MGKYSSLERLISFKLFTAKIYSQEGGAGMPPIVACSPKRSPVIMFLF
jgi:hypothetical protein